MPLSNTKRNGIIALIGLLIILLVGSGAYYYFRIKSNYQAATNPTIYVQSSKTAFGLGENITASIIVDGAGAQFTSFQTNVTLTNLTVVGTPTLGATVTNWQNTPDSSDLSFTGGVQTSTASAVTVFTVTLRAVALGSASISLTNGGIYQVQPDGVTVNNILATLTGATYTVQSTPTVSAGADKTSYANVPIALTGSVDDASNTLLWTKISGPGTVTFTPANTLTPSVKASLAGSYVLRLTATNLALQTAYDEMTLTVTNQPAPVVSAGADKKGYPAISYTLSGVDSNSTDTWLWSQVSVLPTGGVATFTSATSLTPTVKFSLPGVYTLKLIATNQSLLSTSDTMVFTVQKTGDINNDNVVDILDFTLLLNNWGTPSSNPLADLNNSAPPLVDILDFGTLLSAWPVN